MSEEKQEFKTIDQKDRTLPAYWKASIFDPHRHQHETYDNLYVSGRRRELANAIIALIENAEDMLVICSFLLAEQDIEDALKEAALRGVRIYMMLACEHRLENTSDDDFEKHCEAQHRAMLQRLSGKILIRSAPHYHAKIILADSHSDNPKGLLLTANLTKEALERNQELAIILSATEINDMMKMLKWAMFEYAKHEIIDTENFTSVKPLGEIEHPQLQNSAMMGIQATTPHVTSIKTSLLQIIAEADEELIVSSFGWQQDHQLIDAICERAKNGVTVKILTRIRSNNKPALLKLSQAGAQIYGFKWLHAKAIWVDQGKGMIMSANMQKDGLDKGFELGILLADAKAQTLKTCLDDLLLKKHLILKTDGKLGDELGKIQIWHNNQLQEIEIIESVTKSLPHGAAIPQQPDVLACPAHSITYAISPAPQKKESKKKK